MDGSIFSALDGLVEDAFFSDVQKNTENEEEEKPKVPKVEDVKKIKPEMFEDEEAGTLHLCDHCNFQTEDLDDFIDHVHNNLPHVQFCLQCPAEFYKKAPLLRHYEERHGSKLFISCESCRFQALTKEALQKHKFTSHVKNEYSCLNCNYFFDSSDEFVAHLQTHGFEKIKTGQKIARIENRGGAKKGGRKPGPKPKLGPDSSPRPRGGTVPEWTQHATLDGEGNLQCNHCQYKSGTRFNISRHYAKHHSQLYKCTECEYRGACKFDLVRHSVVHGKEKTKQVQIKANTNNKVIKRPYNRKVKVEAKVNNNEAKTNISNLVPQLGQKTISYICDVCFMVLPSLEIMVKHKEYKHNDTMVQGLL